jgi:hypothetical protein
MPNWKKVITSGSDASLNSLDVTSTGSFGRIEANTLQLGNLGAANEILIVGTNTQVTSSDLLSIDTANQRLGIGTSNPEVKLDIVGESSGEAQVRVAQHDNTSDGPDIRFFKSHGTAASPTAIANGDYIGAVNAFVYDGSSYLQSGFFGFQADGIDGDTTFGLRTRVDGTLADRIAINAVGDVNIAENLTVTGDITGSDITIDDWGSISASLASIEAGATSTTLQEVTDNGATTTNTISVPAVTINSTGSDFLRLGFEAGYSNPNNTWPGNGGVIIGTQALKSYSGNLDSITIVGDYAAATATSMGDHVTLIGHNVAASNTIIGRDTTAIGFQAMIGFPGGGNSNTIIGSNALYNYHGGSELIAIGYQAGPQAVSYTGSGNFYIGRNSGNKYNTYNLVPEDSIYFGNYTKSTFAASLGSRTENEIVIGHYATGSGTNTVTIGNSSITNNYFSGDISGSDVTIDDWGSVSASLSTLSGTLSGGTISGIPLGSNLENLVVDNVSLQLNSGTTYNGSSELTISAKTGSVGNGNTTLVSGDGVYDYVNPISASIASDIASIQGSGYVDVSSGGASNRIAIFSDADSLKGDADVTYYSGYNPQSQTYDVWDDVNSEGIKSKTLTTQGIYVGQVGTNFTASIALEANVGPISFYTETKAVGFNVPTSGTHAIHVDTGYAFFINYHLGDGTNYRAGTITINTNFGSSVVFSETSTADLGDTSLHEFSVGYSSGTMTLYMSTNGGVEGTMEVRRMVSI